MKGNTRKTGLCSPNRWCQETARGFVFIGWTNHWTCSVGFGIRVRLQTGRVNAQDYGIIDGQGWTQRQPEKDVQIL